MTEQDLRNEFKDITGDNWINSQGEPDIDYVSFLETQLIRNLGDIGDVNNCNGVKDPNIVKTYALITGKDGLTDVWCQGECLGKGLDTDGINKLNL